MIRVIGTRGTGKTRELIKTAAANNGVIVCHNTQAMIAKIHAYGYSNIPVIGYDEFDFNKEYTQPHYIDDLDLLLVRFNIDGYTITTEE